MENNLKNKSKFFAQYWGQSNIFSPLNQNPEPFATHNLTTEYLKDYVLQLKSLSSITDDDAIATSKIENGRYTESHLNRGKVLIKNFSEYADCTHSLKNSLQLIEMVDFLRSKGYALPWMGLSVDKLVEYGWIKLKTDLL